MRHRKVCVLVLAAILALGGAASADILNWYGLDWDTQPLQNYTGGSVIIGTDGHLWTYSGGATKLQWFVDYTSEDPNFQERYGVAKMIVPIDKVGQSISTLQINLYDGQQYGKNGWSVVLKNGSGRVIDFGVRPYFATAKIRAMVFDGTAWSGNTYLLTRTRTGNDYYNLTFTHLDDGTIHVGVQAYQDTAPVTASWTSPIPFGDIEEVYLVAASSAADNVYFKWTKVIPMWSSSKVVGMSNRATYDPIMQNAAYQQKIKLWGTVLMDGYTPNEFLLDDGSGKVVKISAYGQPAFFGNYIEVTGYLDPTTNPPTLNSDATSVLILR